jgi:hypothetical protein
MKRIRIYILTIFCVLTGSELFGQTNNSCDTIYDFVEKMPQYKNDVNGLADYFLKELTPILSDCYKRESILTSSMYLTLTIDQKGRVVDIDFLRIQATDNCKNELIQKIRTMSGWSPGIHNGEPVCCHFNWPVSCIKWEE